MIKNYLQELNITGSQIDEKNVQKIIDIIEKTILKKKTIFVCGNGGSCAIASHTLCDWVKRLHPLVNCKIYDLTANKSLISAISNDISYDEIFSYQLKILSEKDDICIFISSSGNSKNIIKGLEYTKKNKIKSISIVGFDGGKSIKLSDYSIHIKTNKYEHHEDLSQIIMHHIYGSLRKRFERNRKK
jgi:phosphoheptose isomerase